MTESGDNLAPSAATRTGWLLLLAAVVSWGIVMFPVFTAGPLVLDEHVSYWTIDSDLPGTIFERSLSQTALPPLSSSAQWAFVKIFGKTELALRLPSILALLAALPLVFLTGRSLGGPVCGGLAALLLVWHPEAMDETRIARCYGQVIFFSALLTWASVNWIQQTQKNRWLILWSLSAMTLLWTHYTAALLVAASSLGLLILTLTREFSWKRLLHWVAANVVVLVLLIPLIPALIRLADWGPFLNYLSLNQSIWNVIGPFWWMTLPVALTISLLLERSVNATQRLSWSTVFFLLGCSILPLIVLALLVMGEYSSLANPRYRVAYAVPGVCLLAMLCCRSTRRSVSIGAAVVAIALAWWVAGANPLHAGRLCDVAAAEWREAAIHIENHSHPGEPILVQSGLVESYLVPALPDNPQFLEYVASRMSKFYLPSKHLRIGLPFLWDSRSQIRQVYQDRLHKWRNGEHPTFWVACATDTDLNRNSLAGIHELSLQAGFVPTQEKTWQTLTLIRFSLASGGQGTDQ